MQGRPREIPHGCSEIVEEVNPKYNRGILSLFVYFSPGGEFPKPKNVNIVFEGESKSLTVPIVQFPQNPQAEEYKRLFDNYSLGFVKLGQPRFKVYEITRD